MDEGRKQVCVTYEFDDGSKITLTIPITYEPKGRGVEVTVGVNAAEALVATLRELP